MRAFDEAMVRLTAPDGDFPVERDMATGALRFTGPPATVRELLDRADEGAPLLWHDGVWWTVGDIRRRAVDLAHRLVDRFGVQPGDPVALLGHNSPEWVVGFFAIVGAGAAAVPLNAWWTAPEIEWAVSHAQARTVLTHPRLQERLRDVPVEVVTVELSCPGANDGLRMQAGASWPSAGPVGSDVATVLYTSGSSGFPKGVVSTHDAVMQAVWAFGCRAGAEAWEHWYVPAPTNTRTLLAVPLFHVTGCVSVLLGALRTGGRVVLMGRWDPGRALALIAQVQVTHVVAVPTQWTDLLADPALATADLSSLLRVGGGGAPAGPGVVNRLADRLGPAGVGIGYGMTETNGYGPVNAGKAYLDEPTCCGRVVPIARVEARDASGAAVRPGDEGELWFRGPHLASGYWRDADATGQTWVDGWVRSGDLGRVSMDGRVYVSGRQKDVILRAGENISIAEVETVILQHPAVREAAVFGRPDERLGESVAAALVRAPGATVTTDELLEWLTVRLARYKVPAQIWWWDDLLPRTASGKLARAEVRRQLADS